MHNKHGKYYDWAYTQNVFCCVLARTVCFSMYPVGLNGCKCIVNISQKSLIIYNLFCSYRKVKNRRQSCVMREVHKFEFKIQTASKYIIQLITQLKKIVYEQRYADHCETKYVQVRHLQGNAVRQDFVIAIETSALYILINGSKQPVFQELFPILSVSPQKTQVCTLLQVSRMDV
jgi:hypothetical protein